MRASRKTITPMNFAIAKSVARNTSYMMGAQAVTWLSSLVLMLMLPRYLGSVEYGKLYLAMSVAMIFGVLIGFGAPYYITKEIARSRETTAALLVNSVAIRVLLWAVCMGAMAAFAYAAGYTPVVTALILMFGITKLWEGAKLVLASCFQGFEMMQYPSLGAVAERVFAAATGAVALIMGANVFVVGAILALSTLLNFLVVMKFTPKIAPALPRCDWIEAAGLLKTGLPYFLLSLFAVIYYRIDSVMLSLFAPDAVVGWYGAAYRLFDVLMFLPSIFSIAIFPILSRLGAEDPNGLQRTTQKSLECLIMAGAPIGIGMCAFAEPLVDLLFGLPEYQASVTLIQLFSIALLIVYADFVLGSTLFASDRQRQWTIVAFLALLLNPALNYFMIPYTQASMGNGGIGAAVATILTEAFVFAAALHFMPRGFLSGFRAGVLLKIAGASAVMAGAIWFSDRTGLHWVLQGAAGTACYGVALLLFKSLEPGEIAFVRQCVSPRRFLRLTRFTTG